MPGPRVPADRSGYAHEGPRKRAPERGRGSRFRRIDPLDIFPTQQSGDHSERPSQCVPPGLSSNRGFPGSGRGHRPPAVRRGPPACRWTSSILSGFQRDTQFTSAAWRPAANELHVSWFSWRQGGPLAFQILGPSALRGSSGPHRVSSPLGGGCSSPRRNRNPCSR